MMIMYRVDAQGDGEPGSCDAYREQAAQYVQ
jgi:hypothetical protein